MVLGNYDNSVLKRYGVVVVELRTALATTHHPRLSRGGWMRMVENTVEGVLRRVGRAAPSEEVDALCALRDVLAAYSEADPEGSMLRIIAVCALLDIEIKD